MTRSTIYSSLLNLLLRDGLHLFMTQSTQDTILFLEEFAQKLQKQGTRFLASSQNSRSTETCLFQSMKASAKKKMTPELVYRVQLSAIPGVSLKTATTIMESYPTLQSLMEKLSPLPPEERRTVICNLRSTSTGKPRRLGKKWHTMWRTFFFLAHLRLLQTMATTVPTDANDAARNASACISCLETFVVSTLS